MLLHRNAKLGLAGRYALVQSIEGGCSIREAARRHGVSPATACEWCKRWRAASTEERRTRACLFDRSSRPHRSPRMLSACEQAPICAERRRSGTGHARSQPGSATRTRLSGRRSGAAAAHEPSRSRASPPAATSGRAPATSCTWTGRRSHVSPSRVTPSPATARAQLRRSDARSATTSSTPSSTTTPGSPTPRCSPTRRRRRSPLSWNGRSLSSQDTGSSPSG